MNSSEISIAECILRIVPDASFYMVGEDYNTIDWSDSREKPTLQEIENIRTVIINELPLKILRSERNLLLEESDKYSLPDFPHSSEEVRQEWLNYRQNLRNITTQTPSLDENGFLIGITWPTKPS